MKKGLLILLIAIGVFAFNQLPLEKEVVEKEKRQIDPEVMDRLVNQTLNILAEERGVSVDELELVNKKEQYILIEVEKYGSGNEIYSYRYIPDMEEENRILRSGGRP